MLQMLPALEGGGVERGTLDIARALRQQGHRSLVISAGGRLAPQLEAEGSEHLTWPVTKRSHLLVLRYLWRLRDLLRRERVDILHVRSRHPAWLAWLAWRGMPPHARPRFLTTAHGLYSVNWYSAVMARGERVIAISRTVREYLLNSYRRSVDPERIDVIYRGVDTAAYFPGFRPETEWDQQWRRDFPQLEGRKLLTLPGRLTRLKGHAGFLEILSRVIRENPDVHGLIVGGAEPRRTGYVRELQAEVERRGLTGHVTFTGHRADIREILAVSDLVYSLSANPPEAFGRTVAEALTLGVPVVGYNQAGAGEILQAIFPGGAVPPGDLEAATQRTLTLLSGPRPEIRPNTLFTERRMIDEELDLYRRVA